MAKKTPGQPSDQPSIPEHKSAEVKIALQPVEFFKGNEGRIALELGVTDQYILVYHEASESKIHRYIVYDAEGVQVGELTVPFVITAQALQKLTQDNVYGSDYESQPEERRISGLARNFPEYLRKEIVWRFDKKFGAKIALYAPNFSEAQQKEVLAVPQARITTSLDGNSLVILYQGEVCWVPVKKSDGTAIGSTELTLKNLPQEKMIEVIAANPWLKEFTSKLGEHIPNTDLCVRVENNILNINHEHKATKVYSDAAVDYALDPIDEKKLYYAVPQARELRVIDAERTETHINVESRNIPLSGTIKEFTIDPRGNFFLILTEEEGRGTLFILEKDSLAQVAKIEDVKEKVRVDSVGNIYFIDTNGKLRLANTNFATYEKGGLAKAREEKRQKLEDLQKKLGKGIKLPDAEDLTTANVESMEEDRLIGAIAKRIDTLLNPLITGAQTLGDLDRLDDQIAAMKISEDYLDNVQVFLGVDRKLREREVDLKVADLESQLDHYDEQLKTFSSIEDLLDAERMLLSIRKSRRDVIGLEPAKKREIDDRIRVIEVDVVTQRSMLTEEFGTTIETLFSKIESDMSTMQSMEELNHFVATDLDIAEFEKLLDYLAHQQADVWRMRYRDALFKQNVAIQDALKNEEEQENFRIARTLEEANEILRVISETIDGACDTAKKFDKWMLQSNNPIITRYRAKLLSVPDNLRHEQEEKLEELLKTKRRDLEHRQALQISHDRDEVDFGKHTFPLFRQVQVVWQPKLRPLSDGSDYGHLTFEDNLGHIFRAPSGAISLDTSDEATRETIAAYKSDAAAYFESLKREVPTYNEKWIMSEYIKDHLAKMAKLLKLQMEHQRGIMILEGEAGTGKNVLIDMFCHFTNRETHTFSCNFQTEKEDITYAFKFDPSKGTYNVDSRLIEILQTPGAVLVLDEINALPSGVAKMLNPLLDYRRCLYLPDGRIIKAHPSVLIMGTMNPQHYIGVKPLSQEVKSRARILSVDYPPLQTGNSFHYDEALMLSRYVDSLVDLKDSEFVTVWNYVVNHDSTNGGDKFITPEREKQLLGLLTILKSAQKIREAYRAFRTGASADPIEFVFSMRETIDITTELNGSDDVKTAIKEVILPKISDPLEQTSIATIIDNV